MSLGISRIFNHLEILIYFGLHYPVYTYATYCTFVQPNFSRQLCNTTTLNSQVSGKDKIVLTLYSLSKF